MNKKLCEEKRTNKSKKIKNNKNKSKNWEEVGLEITVMNQSLKRGLGKLALSPGQRDSQGKEN